MKATLIIFAVFFVVVDQFALLNAGTIFFLKNSCKRVMKSKMEFKHKIIQLRRVHTFFVFCKKSNFGGEAKSPYSLLRFEPENVLNMFLF